MATATAAGQDVQKQFEQAGFTVNSAQSGDLEVSKSGFAISLARRGSKWLEAGAPLFLGHGIPCELEDRGYQKFWFSKSEGKCFPIRKIELEALHRFDEEVRYILGTTNLYNESLGSTNARTVYDRLTGRPDR